MDRYKNTQSLSIVSNSKVCINDCPFCVSAVRNDDHLYPDLLNINNPEFDKAYAKLKLNIKRVKDGGCDSIVITGTNEPQQNRVFLAILGTILSDFENPFSKVDIQTTGVSIDRDYLLFLRDHVKVTTISISLSSLDEDLNNKIIKPSSSKNRVNTRELARLAKELGLIVRLSINMTDNVTETPEEIFQISKDEFYADQVTIREMYLSDHTSKESQWLLDNLKVSPHKAEEVLHYVKQHGTVIGKLPYGPTLYNINNISVAIDTDCMGVDGIDIHKFLIIRQDGNLYSRWDTPAARLT